MTAAAPSLRDAYQFVLGNALSEQEQKSLAATFSAVSSGRHAPNGACCWHNQAETVRAAADHAAGVQQDSRTRLQTAMGVIRMFRLTQYHAVTFLQAQPP